MSTPRNALSDLNSSTLNSRLNESDKPVAALKGYNENPFRTKSRVERTPDFSAIKRRKSTTSAILVQPMEEQSEVDCHAKEASFKSPSPHQAFCNDSRMSTMNIFKGFALSNEQGTADEEDNLVGTANNSFHDVQPVPVVENVTPMMTDSGEDVDDIPDQIVERTESRNNDAMDDSTYDNDLNSVESELNQLNIDEVLQAFRDDAEAAEKAIEMATICGRLHPKEFREYLRAFRSPIKQSDEQIMKNELEWNYTRAQSARVMSGEDSATLLTLPKIQAFSSPKSSLLNMLEMADTPIGGVALKNNLACSPILMSVECTPLPGVDDEWGTPLPKVEEENVKGEASRHHSLKDRTETTRLAVAAAVASVSNFPFATSTPSYPDSTTALHCTQSGNAIVPLAPKMIRIPLHIPSIAEQLSSPAAITTQSPGKLEEGFLPRKVMMRTPPKCTEETVVKSVPDQGLGALEDKLVEQTEGACHDDSVLLETNPIEDELHVPALLVDTSVLNESVRNTSQCTSGLPEWSVTELDRVSRVIRRVSVGAADCPNTHSIIRQLQVEIARLTREVSVQHSELAAVVADKIALESRLEEVELETQKAGQTIATLQATSEMRSAVHDQLQIDLELIAAKECIERLADRKEVIAQRRTLREARLQQIDAEVAAEIASLKMRKEIRRESSRHRLLLLPLETACDEMDPSSFIPDISPTVSAPTPSSTESLTPQISHFLAVSSPSYSSAKFKHATQPLVPSNECPFFAPRPMKPLSEGRSFFQAGTGTFSGSISGAFHAIERILPPSAVKHNGNILNNVDKETAIVSECVMTENCDTGIEIGENIEDDICNTENSIHGFEDGMEDIEYNETDGRTAGSDNIDNSFMVENNENENFPSEIDDDSNKENSAHTGTERDTHQIEDDNMNNKKKSDGKKAPRVVNVNYYGNLKFVALKVKSSRPRPLDEKDYGLDLDNDGSEGDDSEGLKEKDVEKENETVGKVKEKKRIAVKREKRGRSNSMDVDRETEEAGTVEDPSSSSSSSEAVSTIPQEKSIEKKTVPRKSKKEQKTQNVEKDGNKITENNNGKNNTKKSPTAVLPSQKGNSEEEIVEHSDTAPPEKGMSSEVKENKKGKRIKLMKPTVDANTENVLEAISSSGIDITEKTNSKNKGIRKVSVSKIEGVAAVSSSKAISSESEEVVAVDNHAQKVSSTVGEKGESSDASIPIAIVPGVSQSQSVRNATPYAFFCASRKAEMRRSRPSLSASELLKTASAEWKALSAGDKEEWVGRSAAAGGGTGTGVGSDLKSDTVVMKAIEKEDCASESACPMTVPESREEEDKDKEEASIQVPALMTSQIHETITKIKPLKVEKESKSKSERAPPPVISSTLVSNTKDKEEEEDEDSSDSQDSSDLYEISKPSSKSKKNKKGTSSKKKSGVQQPLLHESSSKSSSGKNVLQKSSSSAFDKEPEEGLFSANLSLSPVLPGPTSPAIDNVTDLEFDMLLPKGKKEKVSRKRKDQPVVLAPDSSIPEPGTSSADMKNEVNIAQKEQRHITWSDMPPPAAKMKKPRTQNSSSSSSSSIPTMSAEKVLENPFPLEPGGNSRPPRDPAGDKGRAKSAGLVSESSSNLLNTSVSTVSSIFSTTSSVRSKSQFILPKLKKRT